MPRPDDSERRCGIERILISIAVHGPEAIFDHLDRFRALHALDRDGFLEVRCALAAAGMDASSIHDLISPVHERNCACWRCVMRLYVQASRKAFEADILAEFDVTPPPAPAPAGEQAA